MDFEAKSLEGVNGSEISRLDIPRFAPIETRALGKVLRRHGWKVIAILLGVFFFSSYAIGKPKNRAIRNENLSKPVPQEDLVSIDFPEPVELLDIVKQVAYWTNKNVILDNKALGKIQILGPQKVTKDEAYQAFLSALTSQGLVAVETGQIIRIQARRQGLRGAYTPIIEAGKVNYSDRVYTQIFPIKHMDVERLRNVLAFVIASESLVAWGPTNSLIMTETGFNLRKIAQIISIIDNKETENNFEFIRLRNIQAAEAAKKLTDLFAILVQSPSNLFKFIPHETFNTIVIVGAPNQRRDARKALAELDKAPQGAQSNLGIYVHPLMFADAKKMASILQSLGPVESPQKEDKLQIVPDEQTNSLLFKGSLAAYKSMRGIVRRLDAQKSQVFLQCDIVSIASINNFSFLPSLLAGYGAGDGSGTKTLIGYQAEAMTPLILAQNNPTATEENMKHLKSAFGSDFTVGTFPGGSVTIPGLGKISPGALLKMMKTDAYGRSVASPQILAMESEESSFTMGQTLNYLNTRVDAQGANTQTVEKENVDLTLKVTPTLSNSSYLNLQIEIESHSVVGIAANGTPQIAKKKARQLVNFKNGQTILISGIRNLDRSESKATIPFFGSIPMIGYLVNSSKTENRMDYTFIFITAHVIRGMEDLQALYEKKFEDEDPRKTLRAGGYYESK